METPEVPVQEGISRFGLVGRALAEPQVPDRVSCHECDSNAFSAEALGCTSFQTLLSTY